VLGDRRPHGRGRRPVVRAQPSIAFSHAAVIRRDTLKQLFIDGIDVLGLNAALRPRYAGLGSC
jgi:hypothetical protein